MELQRPLSILSNIALKMSVPMSMPPKLKKRLMLLLICVHIRYSRDYSFPFQVVISNIETNKSPILEFQVQLSEKLMSNVLFKKVKFLEIHEIFLQY